MGVAVNPNTNRIYVMDDEYWHFYVIDGATNHAAEIAAPTHLFVAINPNTNRVYMTPEEFSESLVIDDPTAPIPMQVTLPVEPLKPVLMERPVAW